MQQFRACATIFFYFDIGNFFEDCLWNNFLTFIEEISFEDCLSNNFQPMQQVF